jgi:O-acetyl-ADP-ribose deacetylase (regulator of RNase III)
MLKYVVTNLFDSPAQTLVNTVNVVGVMGKGIAAEFKRRYPDMFEKYRQFCQQGSLTVGKLFLYKSANKWVLNFPTKEHWRNPSRVEYIEEGLRKFAETYAEHGITSISFPQLGTGNGGLAWEGVVRPLMEQYLRTLAIPVFIHVAHVPVDFVPEHLDAHRKRDLQARRVNIELQDFFSDLSQVASVESSPRRLDDLEGNVGLPVVRINSTVTIPGEEFAVLWEDLKLRGAVATDEYPPLIAQHAAEITKLLLQLGYIERMQFESSLEGIRFAPAPDLEGKTTSVLTERETISR